RATYEEYTKGGVEGFEAENRVFYVGVTRVKDTLVLVEPTTKRHYSFPSVAITEGVL
ncbi:MAG: hypothetical protein IT459_08050, partial [Planctomycetes bacterium]|nr:hypothetical protein [Planctomycetota bacterium]